MNWGLIQTILTIVSIGIAVLLALRLTRRKKPVWAYTTRRILGLGANAPPELELTFNGRPVDDVYKTVAIFFNEGNESIRPDDFAEHAAISFKEAHILREPTVLATSREAIRASAKQVVKDGDDAIELSFMYLDHDDGVAIEVLHTKGKSITCSGNIIGAKEIGYIGEFRPGRPPLWLSILFGCMVAIGPALIYVLFKVVTAGVSNLREGYGFPLLIAVLAYSAFLYIRELVEVPRFYYYLKFPKWSGVLKKAVY